MRSYKREVPKFSCKPIFSRQIIPLSMTNLVAIFMNIISTFKDKILICLYHNSLCNHIEALNSKESLKVRTDNFLVRLRLELKPI